MSNGNKKGPDALQPGARSVQARHEDSVLFTLTDLGKAASKARPKAARPVISATHDEDDASGYINIEHTGSLFSSPEGRQGPTTTGHAVDDSSGFIDINSLASLRGNNAPAGPTEANFTAEAAPIMPGMIPMGTRQSNNGIKIALGAAVGALVLALGVLVVILLTRDDSPRIVEREAPPSAENLVAPVEDDLPANEKVPDPTPDGAEGVADKAPEGTPDGGLPTDGVGAADNAEKDGEKDAAAEQGDLDKKTGEGDKAIAKNDPQAGDKDNNPGEGDKALDPDGQVEAKDPNNEDGKNNPDEGDKKLPPANPLDGEKKDRMDTILDGLGNKKPEAAEGNPDLPDTLSRAVVKSVVGRHKANINGCGGPDKSGTVIVRFTILPTGAVGGAQVAGEKAGTVEAGCVAAVVRSMQFPPFNGASMTINYPFVLP